MTAMKVASAPEPEALLTPMLTGRMWRSLCSATTSTVLSKIWARPVLEGMREPDCGDKQAAVGQAF
jgi:hypothetical protein